MMKKYGYQVVSGAAVLSNRLLAIQEAKRLTILQRERGNEGAEVERVEELDCGGRRYWRWRGGKWSHRSHYDPTEKDLERWSA